MSKTSTVLQSVPPLPPDTELGGRFRIVKAGPDCQLGHSYVVIPLDESSAEEVLLRLLPAEAAPTYYAFAERLTLATGCTHRSLTQLRSHGIIDDQPFLTCDLVTGQTLESTIQRKRASSSAFLPRTALSLVTPVCQALTAVHNVLPHGALTPGCILVGHTGRTHLTDLGCGWLANVVLRHSGHSLLSPFIAPEVRDFPEAATVASDVYSVGLVVVAMLTDIPLVEKNGETLSHFLTDVPPRLGSFLERTLSDDPAVRPPTVRAFLEELADGIEDLRDKIIEMSGESPALVVAKHGSAKSTQRGFSKAASLSGLLAAADLPPVPGAGERAVWLVHKDGFDYGPYTSEQVRERLLQDEIDEHTDIRNTETRNRGYLTEIDEFADFVADYIPAREERKRREEVHRAEVQRKVKRAGATGIITIIVGVLGLFGLYLYYVEFMRPQPAKIPLESAFAVVASELEPPNMSYVGIAADPELIAALLSPEEPEPPPQQRRRRRHHDPDDEYPPDGEIDDGDPLDRGTIDFTTNGSARRLTQADINATIHMEARAIHRCFARERAGNPDFARLGRITVQFTVRPDGRPVGVSMTPGSYTDDLRSCVVRVFRSLRYPEHNGMALPVTFPIEIQ